MSALALCILHISLATVICYILESKVSISHTISSTYFFVAGLQSYSGVYGVAQSTQVANTDFNAGVPVVISTAVQLDIDNDILVLTKSVTQAYGLSHTRSLH